MDKKDTKQKTLTVLKILYFSVLFQLHPGLGQLKPGHGMPQQITELQKIPYRWNKDI